MSNRNRNDRSTIDTYSLEPDGDPREGGGEYTPRERRERRVAWRGRWREAALNEALRRDDGCGDEATNIVIANARERLPGSTQVILRGADEYVALKALREEVADFRSIVAGNLLHRSSDGEVFTPYAGWYGFEWEDEWVEAAILPARFNPDFVFISDSREAAESVARRVHGRTARPEGQCMTYSGGRKWRGAPDMDAEVSKVSWEDIVLSPETILEIRGSIERFFERREAYREMDLAWRRGILLVGPPGTGKTMACKAIAASAPELPFLYVRDIDAADDEREIGAVFGRARALSPSILVFEDIDGLVNEANRSVFLNELDGFKSNDGVLVVASSNHPERIDEALLKRPSRFDRVFRLGLPALSGRGRSTAVDSSPVRPWPGASSPRQTSATWHATSPKRRRVSPPRTSRRRSSPPRSLRCRMGRSSGDNLGGSCWSRWSRCGPTSGAPETPRSSAK